MASRQFIPQIARILLVIGLVFGPALVVPNANAMAHVAMSAMADDMPCRPLDQTTTPDCLASCPLMAVCAGGCLSTGLAVSGPGLGLKGVVIRPGINVLCSPQSEPPPARPPQT